ncbi:MAG: hypothetical protein WDA16_02945 [Candidatus Thermoplasmatota archaeon]
MSPVPLAALRSGDLPRTVRPDSHPARVLTFLTKHREEAWRAHELAEKLGTDQHTMGAALRRLRSRGLIDKQGPYWFALSEQESAQLQAALATTLAANEHLGAEDPDDWAHNPR